MIHGTWWCENCGAAGEIEIDAPASKLPTRELVRNHAMSDHDNVNVEEKASGGKPCTEPIIGAKIEIAYERIDRAS